MTPQDLETDPETVLDPTQFEDTPWAETLADDPDRARDQFVSRIRRGPPRTSPDTDLTALRRRWYGDEVGYERGFHLDPGDVVEGRHVGVYGIEHRFEDAIDWFYNASADDEGADFTREWQWQLNRHYQWVTLADAFDETGDPTYAETFERELRSWLDDCPRPADSGNYHPSAWRTIEAGIRAGWIWPYAFETFRRSDAVSDDALWWWMCSFRDHGRHLLRHITGDNWKTMEFNGLVHVGAMFPELDGADSFLSTGIDRAVAEIERQFYPDGLQTELAPGYGLLAIGNSYSALELARQSNDNRYSRAATGVPKRSHERLAEAAQAYARLAAPDGRCPQLHDSKSADARPVFEEFHDDSPPWASTTSDVLPWGGYGIVRTEGRYAMLDAGPYGTGHQHQDTLQVVGYAADDWAVVDLGAPQYTDSPITKQVRSAAGHNVVLLDGERHVIRPEIHRATTPPPLAKAESERLAAAAATRTFETEGGTWFDHERVLSDVEHAGWVVYDRLVPRDDREHTAEWLWHAAGAVSAGTHGGTIRTESGAEISLSVDGGSTLTAATVSGTTDPYRGWGPSGDTVEPTPVPTLAVNSGTWTDEFEAVTLLSPTGATLDGHSDNRIVIDAEPGGITLELTESSGRIETIRYRAASETDEIRLEPHAHLGSR